MASGQVQVSILFDEDGIVVSTFVSVARMSAAADASARWPVFRAITGGRLQKHAAGQRQQQAQTALQASLHERMRDVVTASGQYAQSLADQQYFRSTKAHMALIANASMMGTALRPLCGDRLAGELAQRMSGYAMQIMALGQASLDSDPAAMQAVLQDLQATGQGLVSLLAAGAQTDQALSNWHAFVTAQQAQIGAIVQGRPAEERDARSRAAADAADALATALAGLVTNRGDMLVV